MQGLFPTTLDWALRWVFLISLPAAVGLAVLARPMLSTIFQYQVFSEHDVIMAARSLVAYGSGLMGFVFIKVLAPGFFARQDTRTPVKIGVIAMVVNMVLNLALVLPLAHAGLALATALSAYVNAALLLRVLLNEGIYRPAPGWGGYLARVGISSAVMAGVLITGRADDRRMERVGRLDAGVASGAMGSGRRRGLFCRSRVTRPARARIWLTDLHILPTAPSR